MLRFVLVLLLITGKVLPALAHIENIYYLQGKVAQREVAMKMICYDELPTRYIYYYFLNDKRDRYMMGKLVNGSYRFSPTEQNGQCFPKPEGTWTMAVKASNAWQGVWTDPQGKNWEFVLKPIVPDATSASFNDLRFVKELDPYEGYRLSTIQFVKTKTETAANGLLSDWYTEKESGVSFFRVRTVTNPTKLAALNAALTTIHLTMVQKYFAYLPQKTALRYETKLLYLTSELVSFRTFSTTPLMASNPVQAQQFTTLDAKTGEPANLEDIIWFDKSESKPAMSDFYAIYQYRKKIFAPKIYSLLQQLYPAKMKSDSCGINKMETWTLLAWNLMEKGILFGLNSPNGCEVYKWAFIPYDKMKPYVENKYHLKISGK